MPERRSRAEFASVTISFFIHSTEDESRLISQASRSLGISPESFELETLEGHYGNVIHSAKAHIVGYQADTVSKFILGRLDSSCKATIVSDLERSIDEHDSLYLRLDRQLLGQSLVLGAEEPIRVKLKPKKRYVNRMAVRDAYQELLKP
jgi:RNA binding exosome subunit